MTDDLLKDAAKRDPAQEFMNENPEWGGPTYMNNGHRRWTWANPADGRIHNITCGNGGHSEDDAWQDARMLKSRMRLCQQGACNCRSQGVQEPEQTQPQPAQQFTPGQQVAYQGQPYWVTEIDGDLAAIMNNAGQDDLVPVSQLQAFGNILDPISNSLDPTIWIHPEAPDPQIDPKLNRWIHQAIYHALEKHGYEGPQRWLTLILTGSLCTYQFSDSSDVDISLFVNAKRFPEWSRAEIIGFLTHALDGVNVPGTTHPLQIFVVASPLKPRDLFKPGLRSAYNLDKDRWIVPPDKSHAHDVEHEMNTSYLHALEVGDKMNRLLTFEPQKAIHYYEILHKLRKKEEGEGHGDFAQSNIDYKYLSNHGYFDKLRDLGVPIT